MRQRFFLLTGAVLMFVMMALGQSANGPTKKTWEPPRRADGQPDLEGVWSSATLTPLERPPEFAGKPFSRRRKLARLRSERSRNEMPTGGAPMK